MHAPIYKQIKIKLLHNSFFQQNMARPILIRNQVLFGGDICLHTDVFSRNYLLYLVTGIYLIVTSLCEITQFVSI